MDSTLQHIAGELSVSSVTPTRRFWKPAPAPLLFAPCACPFAGLAPHLLAVIHLSLKYDIVRPVGPSSESLSLGPTHLWDLRCTYSPESLLTSRRRSEPTEGTSGAAFTWGFGSNKRDGLEVLLSERSVHGWDGWTPRDQIPLGFCIMQDTGQSV